jgi:hypothetical protein
MNCEYCLKKLIKFRNKNDWAGRKLHLSCWKKKRELRMKKATDELLKGLF